MAKNKTELYNGVVASLNEVFGRYEVEDDAAMAVLAVIDANLKPGVFGGGNRLNLEEVVKRDETGAIVEMQCMLSKAWLPATLDYFYEEKKGPGINGLRRLSRLAEKVRKQHIADVTKRKALISQNVFDGTISVEEGKAQMAELDMEKPDFSVVQA